MLSCKHLQNYIRNKIGCQEFFFIDDTSVALLEHLFPAGAFTQSVKNATLLRRKLRIQPLTTFFSQSIAGAVHRTMSQTLEIVQSYAKFPFQVRKHIQQTLTVEKAKEIVQERMTRRGELFLALAENTIYNNPRSPYLPLLRLARCELGDLRASVQGRGLDRTLMDLREQGVYVMFEEFKGRTPIVRPGLELVVTEQDFNHPGMRGGFHGTTGGSTGRGSQTTVNLAHTRALAPHYLLAFATHDILNLRYLLWRGILPDMSGIGRVMDGLYFGVHYDNWYSHLDPRDTPLKYVVATFFMWGCARLNGAYIPLPKYLPLDKADVIARQLYAMLQSEGRCMISVQVSRAMRICLAAQEAGLDLTGVTFMIAGEPPTPAKVREITRTGARFFPTYGFGEVGRLAMGCGNPMDCDDLHLMHDAFVLFSNPYRVPGFEIEVPAFNITTLLPTTPKILLNVEIDDYGIVEERHCGCALEEVGYTTHLREIRSYSKLTGEGVTLVGSELVHLLEHELPARFGGSPLDYQFQEQEDAQGFTRLYLVISPRVTIVDEAEVSAFVMEALKRSSPMANATRSVWQSAGTLQVKRAEPTWTARGKLLPLHIQHPARK